jgi:predicted MPP superfamily phosphohydrolase
VPASPGGSPGGGAGVLAVLAAGAVATVSLVATGLRFWGLVHLGYLLVVVSLPLVGTAVGARVVDGSLGPAWSAVALVLLLPAPLGWYGTHVEPYRLRLDHRTVPVAAARPGSRRVRLGVLADLQTGRAGPYEHAAVDRLLAAEPDVILVPGDLFQGSADQLDREEDGMRALLGRLQAPHGVYFARGDTDGGGFADRLLPGTGVVILDDEAVDVTVGDRRLRIGGNRLAYWEDPAVRLRRRLDGEPDDGTVRILVAHRPDAVLDLRPGSPVDLTVAGHTHGGQIVVPGFGPLLTLSKVPRRVGGGGLHRVNGNWIYVSTGVGLERRQAPQVRLFCRPTIALLDLAPEPEGNLGRNAP